MTAADYTTWRNHLNTAFVLPNRFRTLTGNVGINDYKVWKMNYGNPNVMSLAEPGNFSHLILEGDWHMWFQPYNSSRTENAMAIADNFAHLYQDVPGTPGLNYTMEGWALFRALFSGGRITSEFGRFQRHTTRRRSTFANRAFFALEFLDATGTVLAGSGEKELMADGQTSHPAMYLDEAYPQCSCTGGYEQSSCSDINARRCLESARPATKCRSSPMRFH